MTTTATKEPFHGVLNPRLFCAASRCASTRPERPHIQGLRIAPTAEGVRLVATDGMILFCADDIEGQASRYAVIRPPKKKMQKTWTRHDRVILDGDTVKGADVSGGTTVDSDLIAAAPEIHDAGLLDYKRTIPSDVSGETAQFDPSYVKLLGEIGDFLGCPKPMIYHNGEAPALFHFDHGIFGLLMPLHPNQHAARFDQDRLKAHIARIKAE